MKKYLLISTEKCHLTESIRKAKKIFGNGTWDNIPFMQITWPQWITSSRERAVMDAREQNRKDRERHREKAGVPNVMFFVELKEYD